MIKRVFAKDLKILVIGVLGALSLGLGVADAGAASSGYLTMQSDCWIGSHHYGARTTILYRATSLYTVTQQSYQTSPAAKAHRVEWRTKHNNVVRYALGRASISYNDVPSSKTFYPKQSTFSQDTIVFKVWDGPSGTYCEDSYPIIRYL